MNDRVSVDYDMSDDYNIFIEFLDNCTQKVQFAFCPHLPPIWDNYQNILKNTCRNEPGKWLKQLVPEGQGRNEDCPIEGIDTRFADEPSQKFLHVEMRIARQRAQELT